MNSDKFHNLSRSFIILLRSQNFANKTTRAVLNYSVVWIIAQNILPLVMLTLDEKQVQVFATSDNNPTLARIRLHLFHILRQVVVQWEEKCSTWMHFSVWLPSLYWKAIVFFLRLNIVAWVMTVPLKVFSKPYSFFWRATVPLINFFQQQYDYPQEMFF